jgi:hypothetical protein
MDFYSFLYVLNIQYGAYEETEVRIECKLLLTGDVCIDLAS